MKTSSFIVLGALLLPASALAQEAPDPLRSPGFVTLDRFDQSSRVGAEASYVLFDDDGGGTVPQDASGQRFDFHGHYVDRKSGFGGYASVPIGRGSAGDVSGTQLGNIEAGALYTKAFAGAFGFIGRVGFTVPTASADADKQLGGLPSASRITDAVQFIPKGIAARVSVSPTIRAGKIFGRADFGYDLVVDAENEDQDSIARLGIGAGYDGGAWAAGGEFALAKVGDASLTTAALFGRFRAGPVTPYVAVVIPFGDDLDGVTFALTGGLEAKLY